VRLLKRWDVLRMEKNEELKYDVVKFAETIGNVELASWQKDFLLKLEKTHPIIEEDDL
jgi:hypothetical protein